MIPPDPTVRPSAPSDKPAVPAGQGHAGPFPPELRGPRVRLSPLTFAQLATRSQWTADNELARLMGVDLEAEPFESLEKEAENNRQWLYLRQLHGAMVYAIEVDGQYIGDIDVNVEPQEELAQLTVFIGERAQWGKGYGTAAVQLVLRALLLGPPRKEQDDPLAVEEEYVPPQAVVVDVAPGNERALRFWQKLGFEAYDEDERGTHYMRLTRAAFLARPAP